MNRGPIDRREALRELSWIGLGLLSASAFAACGESTKAPASGQGVGELLAHKASAAALGAVFLAAHPNEGDFDFIVTRLGLRADSLPAMGSPELVTAAKTIHALHIDDFRRARLIEIEGWMLSLTELRLAALTYLTHSTMGA